LEKKLQARPQWYWGANRPQSWLHLSRLVLSPDIIHHEEDILQAALHNLANSMIFEFLFFSCVQNFVFFGRCLAFCVLLRCTHAMQRSNLYSSKYIRAYKSFPCPIKRLYIVLALPCLLCTLKVHPCNTAFKVQNTFVRKEVLYYLLFN
jgi:hypothetical protein